MDKKTRDLTTLRLEESRFEGVGYDSSVPPIWETICKLASDVPAAEWKKVPRDGARNLDKYLYGSK